MRRPESLYLATALLLLAGACDTNPTVRPEVHGHRGCRGLLPENTVPAFLKAAELGCDWLEMDVVITGDGQVLVSHEPWMDHRICRTPTGEAITPDSERSLNIFRMTLAEVQAYDCGSAVHPDFPDQERSQLQKPTLRQVVEAVDEQTLLGGGRQVGFNIEIKSDPALYGSFQPGPQLFAEIVLSAIDSLDLADRCMLQSFDPAVLEAVHTLDTSIPLALLVENKDGLDANLARLSFRPEVYSPIATLVDAKLVKALHDRDMEIAVWTVNDEAAMRRLIALGVDGIITDHPDRLIELLEADE